MRKEGSCESNLRKSLLKPFDPVNRRNLNIWQSRRFISDTSENKKKIRSSKYKRISERTNYKFIFHIKYLLRYVRVCSKSSLIIK